MRKKEESVEERREKRRKRGGKSGVKWRRLERSVVDWGIANGLSKSEIATLRMYAILGDDLNLVAARKRLASMLSHYSVTVPKSFPEFMRHTQLRRNTVQKTLKDSGASTNHGSGGVDGGDTSLHTPSGFRDSDIISTQTAAISKASAATNQLPPWITGPAIHQFSPGDAAVDPGAMFLKAGTPSSLGLLLEKPAATGHPKYQLARKRRGNLQLSDLKAWLHLNKLSLFKASQILGFARQTFDDALEYDHDFYLQNSLSDALDRAIRRGHETDKKRLEKTIEFRIKAIKSPHIHDDTNNYGLDIMELEFWRFWSPMQCRKYEIQEKCKAGTATKEEMKELLRNKTYLFQLERPVACCIVHKPTGIKVVATKHPSFKMNRRRAMIFLSKYVKQIPKPEEMKSAPKPFNWDGVISSDGGKEA